MGGPRAPPRGAGAPTNPLPPPPPLVVRYGHPRARAVEGIRAAGEGCEPMVLGARPAASEVRRAPRREGIGPCSGRAAGTRARSQFLATPRELAPRPRGELGRPDVDLDIRSQRLPREGRGGRRPSTGEIAPPTRLDRSAGTVRGRRKRPRMPSRGPSPVRPRRPPSLHSPPRASDGPGAWRGPCPPSGLPGTR